jgi:seryl-tRNA synthetase
MLDIKLLRTQTDAVRRALTDRGGRFLPALDAFLSVDAEFRAVQKDLEPLQARRNKAADEVGRLKREKKDAAPILKEMEEVKAAIKALEAQAAALEPRLQEALLGLPNIPDPSVPVDTDPAKNPVIRE